MPIYVWICKECGAKVEKLVLKRDKVGKNPYCHECGNKMTKVLGPAGLRFNGDGWQTPKAKEES